MSYLPELRKSMVRAAERQTQTLSAPSRPSRRRPWGSLVLMGASVAALVVAGVVLVLAGHRSRPGGPQAANAPYGSLSAAQSAAEQILAAYKPPPGAVSLSRDPTRPRQLGSPAGRLPVARGIDLHSFFRVPGDPQTIINAIPRMLAASQTLTPGGGGTSSGSAGVGDRTMTASVTYDLATRGGLGRSLQVQAVRVAGGASAVRVDAQAWWLTPRPAGDRIPTGSRMVSVELLGRPPSPHLHPPARLTGSDAAKVIALLNSLSLVQQPTRQACPAPATFRIRLVFLGSGQHPDPVAILRPDCAMVDLSLKGRPQPRLSLSTMDSAKGMLRYVRLFEMLEGLPRSNSLSALRQASQVTSASGSASAPVQVRPAWKP